MAEAPKIPQIVRERLQQDTSPAGVQHPDFDLLTGFSEGALPARERSLVSSHLSTCSSCRDVLMLGQLGAAETGEVAKLPASSASRWMAFRWAALAACFVLTVGIVFFERSLRERGGTATPAELTASAPVVAPSREEAPKTDADRAAATLASTDKPARDKLAPEKRAQTRLAERRFAPPAGYAGMKENSVGRPFGDTQNYGASGTLGRLKRETFPGKASDSYSSNSVAVGEVDRSAQMQPAAPPPPPPSVALDAISPGAAISGTRAKSRSITRLEARQTQGPAQLTPGVSATNASEASNYADQAAGPGLAEQEPGKKKLADESVPLASQMASRRVLARDDKTAVAQSLAKSPASAASNFSLENKDQQEALTSNSEKLATASPTPMQWRIRGGKLQHSSDQGKTWNEVSIPPGVSLRAFWSLGNSAWAGGTEGSLFFVTEAGTNSVRIPIKVDDGDISQTVVSVSFSDEQHGIITLENGQILQTTDGGKTWQRH